MPKLTWDKIGERFYETGVNKGVLYPLNTETNEYDEGFAWNGLVSVSESPSGAEPSPQYADNIKYLNLMSAEEFGATIECFTYPEQFEECDGSRSVAKGVIVTQQSRKTFGFAYQNLIGNDVVGNDYGYKIHLVYGCLASPSEKTRSTVNESPEAATLSYELSTTPVEAPTGFKPTAHVVIDSTKTDPTKLAALEAILYGDDTNKARLPLPTEIATLIGDEVVGG